MRWLRRLLRVWKWVTVLGLLYVVFGYKEESTCWHVELRKDGPVIW